MATILGLDLGKFKSVACLYDTGTAEFRFVAVHTDRDAHRTFLGDERPDLVVFATCTIAGWVADLCDSLQIPRGRQPDPRRPGGPAPPRQRSVLEFDHVTPAVPGS